MTKQTAERDRLTASFQSLLYSSSRPVLAGLSRRGQQSRRFLLVNNNLLAVFAGDRNDKEAVK
jgi:hypothetical protein